jgi:transposase, IS30 family
LKGQSISHIFTHHKDEINCCERTLYYYFDKTAFTARNIDLPRKKTSLPIIKESSDRIGRNYNEFIRFLEDNPNIPVVEMDNVHNTRSGKVLLTFFFRNCSLMLAFLINSCS